MTEDTAPADRAGYRRPPWLIRCLVLLTISSTVFAVATEAYHQVYIDLYEGSDFLNAVVSIPSLMVVLAAGNAAVIVMCMATKRGRMYLRVALCLLSAVLLAILMLAGEVWAGLQLFATQSAFALATAMPSDHPRIVRRGAVHTKLMACVAFVGMLSLVGYMVVGAPPRVDTDAMMLPGPGTGAVSLQGQWRTTSQRVNPDAPEMEWRNEKSTFTQSVTRSSNWITAHIKYSTISTGGYAWPVLPMGHTNASEMKKSCMTIQPVTADDVCTDWQYVARYGRYTVDVRLSGYDLTSQEADRIVAAIDVAAMSAGAAE